MMTRCIHPKYIFIEREKIFLELILKWFRYKKCTYENWFVGWLVVGYISDFFIYLRLKSVIFCKKLYGFKQLILIIIIVICKRAEFQMYYNDTK